jgi:hypothetical protein
MTGVWVAEDDLAEVSHMTVFLSELTSNTAQVATIVPALATMSRHPT